MYAGCLVAGITSMHKRYHIPIALICPISSIATSKTNTYINTYTYTPIHTSYTQTFPHVHTGDRRTIDPNAGASKYPSLSEIHQAGIPAKEIFGR